MSSHIVTHCIGSDVVETSGRHEREIFLDYLSETKCHMVWLSDRNTYDDMGDIESRKEQLRITDRDGNVSIARIVTMF